MKPGSSQKPRSRSGVGQDLDVPSDEEAAALADSDPSRPATAPAEPQGDVPASPVQCATCQMQVLFQGKLPKIDHDPLDDLHGSRSRFGFDPSRSLDGRGRPRQLSPLKDLEEELRKIRAKFRRRRRRRRGGASARSLSDRSRRVRSRRDYWNSPRQSPRSRSQSPRRSHSARRNDSRYYRNAFQARPAEQIPQFVEFDPERLSPEKFLPYSFDAWP